MGSYEGKKVEGGKSFVRIVRPSKKTGGSTEPSVQHARRSQNVEVALRYGFLGCARGTNTRYL